MPRLDVSGLNFSYRLDNARPVPAVADVSFALEPEEFVSIIGPSGCGKSTLFNLISGLLVPDKGSVKLDGSTIVGNPGSVAYMMQRDLLLPWRTVLGNVVLGPEIAGQRLQATRDQAVVLLKRFGLEGFEDSYPAALSGGMRQRAALLRTILCERSVILLDEPFGALDALTRADMREWLLGIQHEFKRTMVLITHDPDEAVFLSDRIYVATQRPMRIEGVVDVSFSGERHKDIILTPAFAAFKRDVLALLNERPDANRRRGAKDGGEM